MNERDSDAKFTNYVKGKLVAHGLTENEADEEIKDSVFAELLKEDPDFTYNHSSSYWAKEILNGIKKIEEIEKELGIDKIQPIALTQSDADDMKGKENEMQQWYEQELRTYYK